MFDKLCALSLSEVRGMYRHGWISLGTYNAVKAYHQTRR